MKRRANPGPALGRSAAEGRAIKGPSGRLKYDVRRVWQCPACGRREHTSGRVVTRCCPCQSEADPPRQVWMRLVENEPPPQGPEP